MDNNNKSAFKQSEVAKIKGVSPSYVSKAASGEIKTQKAEEIIQLLAISQSDIIEIIKDERFYSVCEVAIEKSNVKKEVRKFAVLLQHYHLKLNKANEVS